MARDRYDFQRQFRPSLVMLGAPLLLSACAYAGGITPQEADIRSQASVDQYMPASRDMRDNIETQELFAQAAFWSREYELNPTDLEATLKLASAVRRLGNPGRAVEITQTSRQIHPRDPYLLAEHAAGLIADQRAMDAIPVLDEALRIAPGYARLWSLRGAALDQMEDYDAARGHYDRALQITPNDPNILTNLGLSYALSGDLRAAEMWLRRAASLPDAGPGARQNLALVLQLQGREQDAQREQRLANLSRGDRKLPPAPVPALTPRGTPAQMSGSTQTYGAQPRQTPQPGQAPQWGQQTGQWNTQAQGQASYAPRPQNPSRSPFAPQSKPTSPAQAPAQLHGGYNSGMPTTRLSTTTANGQPYTSASQAARQASQSGGQPQQSGTYNYNQPMTNNQKSVLDSIRQSLQPGAVGPQVPPSSQAAQQAASGPQPHVVGPALMTPGSQAGGQGYAPQGYAYPQQGQAVPGAYGTPQGYTYPQQGYASQGYQTPTEPSSQGPARSRRR